MLLLGKVAAYIAGATAILLLLSTHYMHYTLCYKKRHVSSQMLSWMRLLGFHKSLFDKIKRNHNKL